MRLGQTVATRLCNIVQLRLFALTGEYSRLVLTSDITFPQRFTKTNQEKFSFKFTFVLPQAYARSLKLVLSFVLACASDYVAGGTSPHCQTLGKN